MNKYVEHEFCACVIIIEMTIVESFLVFKPHVPTLCTIKVYPQMYIRHNDKM